jgi:hypothetical protein
MTSGRLETTLRAVIPTLVRRLFLVPALVSVVAIMVMPTFVTRAQSIDFTRADVDHDGCVSILDLARAASLFGQTVPPAPVDADVDQDGHISVLDLAAAASWFGQCHDYKLLFGLGSEADTARAAPLNIDGALGMYTSWYKGPNDLTWMAGWKTTLVPQVYATGRAMHLVIWSGDAETGTPCGRQYPISAGINADMAKLAQIFAGSVNGPPLYITLFTEFQTYPCVDNQWSGAEAYYTQLQTKMLQIRDIFHQNAPNAKVSIGWGGWQTRWDGPSTGGGRSLFAYFDATMRAMDFQSFQAMQGDTNVNDVRQMTRTLGAYGPVMLAHHKPNGLRPDIFDADIRTMATDAFIGEMKGDGLFAWSFMDTAEMASSPAIYADVLSAVRRYGKLR